MIEPYYSDEWVTLYHGDAAEILPIQADAIVTDPPYKLSQAYSPAVDSDNILAVGALSWIAPRMLQSVGPGGLMAMFYDTRLLPWALETARRGGWKYLRALTLYRRWGAASMLEGWMSTSDFILLFAKPGGSREYHGTASHDVYVRASAEADDTGHPAQKPVGIVGNIVQRITPAQGTVLDPFAGSGTTLLAGKAAGVHSVGIELEERYCEIAANRLAQEVLLV